MSDISVDQNGRIDRPSTNYPASVWGCSFASLAPQDSDLNSFTEEVEVLKQRTKDMLMQSTKGLVENIEFVNLLCRLGVSYHFEREIEEQLSHIFTNLLTSLDANDYDLHTVALLFRVLRQHGHKVPCDVFNKFKDSDGKFKESLTHDVKGLLCLYEATFLNVHGEDILDEALAFSRQYLETLAMECSPHLAEHIKYALQVPLHHGMERLEARKYIAFYEKEESRNQGLLRFAKLDYNRLQLLYRQELASVSRWWEELNLKEKLPFARDRIVETYVWALGCLFEPQWTGSRVLIAKYTQMEMTVDDTYDEYATIDELRLFTDAFQRCSVDAIDHLPEYMQYLYKAILKLFGETENDGREGCSYKTAFTKEMFKEVTRAYLLEAEWLNDDYTPKYDEYIGNGMITITGDLLASVFFLGLKDVGIKEMVWLRENPKINYSSKLVARLYDDLTIHEGEEKKKGAVECYMKEYDVPRQKAREELIKTTSVIIWKDVNDDYLNQQSRISGTVLNYFLNTVRMSDFVSRLGDWYTKSETMKGFVTAMFLDQLPL